jgi:hypothetical protein
MSELGSDNPYVEGRVAGGDYSYSQYQLKSAGKVSESDYLFNISRTEIDGYRDHSNARGSVLNTKLGVPIGQSDKLIFALNLTDRRWTHRRPETGTFSSTRANPLSNNASASFTSDTVILAT